MTLRLLLILGALSAFGPLAVDFYLPSFPTLAHEFATDIEHIQLSLAAYFVGIALGQLFYGPLADRFGRRIPLLVGVLLFSGASIACALSPSLDWLIVARFIQALGGCAGMVITRAVVRDLCDPLASAKAFSQLVLVMGVAPILAPLGGGLLLDTLGWPWIFYSLSIFSGLCLLALLLWLPETRPQHIPAAPLSGAFGQYARLLADRQLMAYSAAGGVAMAGMFAYVAGSPYVFIELYGVPAEHFGWLFGSNAAGFVIMAQVNARLVRNGGPSLWLRRMVVVYLLSGLVLLALAWIQPKSLWLLMIPLFICVACLGCVLPNATACAMAGQGQHAGSASALLGSVQFTVAALSAIAVAALHNGSAMPMALIIALCGALGVIIAWRAKKVVL